MGVKAVELEKTGKQKDADLEEGSGLLVVVDRPVYSQIQFDQVYRAPDPPYIPIPQRAKSFCAKTFECSGKCWKNVLLRLLPFITIMKSYNIRTDLVHDIIAGLTVGIMHIPQGMAYAMLAEVPPVYGLYVAFFPVILYFFVGTSRHLSIGHCAVVSLMVGTAVVKHQGTYCRQYMTTPAPTTVTPNMTFQTIPGLYDMNVTVPPTTAAPRGPSQLDQCKVEIAIAVTLMTGITKLVMFLFRLGFLTTYLSHPIMRGFTTGCACHVFTSQVKHVLGISTQRYSGPFKLIYTYIDLFRKIGQTVPAAVITTAICVVVLFFVKELINPKVKAKIKMPVPIELFVVIIGSVVSYYARLNQRFRLSIVGTIPVGFPAPKVPPQNLYGTVLVDGIVIGIVAFAVSVSVAKLFAKKHKYEVDSNQELMAYGVINTVCSFLNCYVVCAGLSRSLVQENTGCKTQVAGLVASVLVLVVILVLGPLFEPLPQAVLAAIILVALKGMFLQLKDLKQLFRVNKVDFACWLVVFFATVVLDVSVGLLVGLAFGLLTVVIRTQRPASISLGRVPHTDVYRDTKRYNIQEIPGLKIFRFESALYYANRDFFVDQIFHKSGLDPRKLMIQRAKVTSRRQKEEKQNEKLKKATEKKRVVITNGSQVELSLEAKYPMPECSLKFLIIDCGSMGFMDTVGMSTLKQTVSEYRDVGVICLLTNIRFEIREMMEADDFFNIISPKHVYLSVHDAVLAALHEHEGSLEEAQHTLGTPIASRVQYRYRNPLDDPNLVITEEDLTTYM